MQATRELLYAAAQSAPRNFTRPRPSQGLPPRSPSSRPLSRPASALGHAAEAARTQGHRGGGGPGRSLLYQQEGVPTVGVGAAGRAPALPQAGPSTYLGALSAAGVPTAPSQMSQSVTAMPSPALSPVCALLGGPCPLPLPLHPGRCSAPTWEPPWAPVVLGKCSRPHHQPCFRIQPPPPSSAPHFSQLTPWTPSVCSHSNQRVLQPLSQTLH